MRGVLAGDRRVWMAGAAVLAAAALLILVYLFKEGDRYTGTNSVGVRSVVTDVPPDQRLCVGDLDVPDGTGRVQLSLGWAGERRPALGLVVRAGETVRRATVPAVAAPGPGGPVPVNLPMREIHTAGESARGRLCLAPTGGTLAVGGTAGLQADQQPPRLDGKPFPARVAVRFLGPEGS